MIPLNFREKITKFKNTAYWYFNILRISRSYRLSQEVESMKTSEMRQQW